MTHGAELPATAPGLAVDGPLASWSVRARAGVLAVYAAGLGTFVALVVATPDGGWQGRHPWAFLPLATAGGLAVLDYVPPWVPRRHLPAGHPASDTGMFARVADLFCVVGALLLPPAGAVLVCLPALLVRHLGRRTGLYRTCYDMCVYVVGGAVTWAVFHGLVGSLGSTPHAVDDVGWVVAAVLAALTFEVVNIAGWTFGHWTMNGATTLRRLLRLYPLWTETSACILAVVVAALWFTGPWLVLLAAGPLVMLRQGVYLRGLELATRTDPKTGLYNVTYFTELAEREIRRAARQGVTLALLVADLDHLRRVNTDHGHLAGDVVVKGVADVLARGVREFDVVCRFGGEEFLVLLPGVDTEEALRTAERLRESIDAAVFHAPTARRPIHVTVSVGVAALGEHGTVLEELMHAADLALYRAKADGRNRVARATPGMRFP